MLKIEAVIPPAKISEVQDVLEALGVERVLISQVLEQSYVGGPTAFYRGGQYRSPIPRVKLELLVSAERADEIVDAIVSAARSPMPGDEGTVTVFEVADAVQVRTGARLQYTMA